jgi:hypothetical protein
VVGWPDFKLPDLSEMFLTEMPTCFRNMLNLQGYFPPAATERVAV